MNVATQTPTNIDGLIAQLVERGFAIVHRFVPGELVNGLLAGALVREQSGDMKEAGVGRTGGAVVDMRIRQALASWLDGRSEAELEFLAIAEALRVALNRHLYLGLFEFEAQFLTYPPGGFYARHVDCLAGARNRVVSLVLYLNEGWSAEDGGVLAIWDPADEEPAAEVLPEAGTLVLMLSEEVPHEVRPASRVRRAISGWFRVNASSSLRTDTCS